MHPKLPDDVKRYAVSKTFTAQNVPSALTKEHRNKPHSWGLIVVNDGALIYSRVGKDPVRVSAGETAVIVPNEPHHVTPDDALLTFCVEFYRRKGTTA